ncbi:MAG: hypothetical protein Q8P51_15230 [Ignavibacteria bacterium]|nr:hypothetical protein [Ignavibacteria bacterium]
MNLTKGIHPGHMLIAKLVTLLADFDSRTGKAATVIKLGANQLRTYREEARLHTRVDILREDMFMGARIIPARHPDDIIIDAGEGED